MVILASLNDDIMVIFNCLSGIFQEIRTFLLMCVVDQTSWKKSEGEREKYIALVSKLFCLLVQEIN